MKKWFAMLAVAGAFFLTACAGGNRENQGSLTIGVFPDVDSIPLIIAQEKGFFKEEGLTVRLVPFKSALDRDSALQSGQLDGAISDMLAAAFARDGGFDAVIVSATTGSYQLAVGKADPAASIRELKNKEIALSKNTVIEYVTDKMLAENGLTPDDVRKVAIPQMPARLEMLANAKVAAAVIPDPLATVARQGGARILARSDQMGINLGVLLFTSTSVTKKEKELRAMARAYNKAVDYLASQPAESYTDIIIEKGGLPPNVKGALVLPAYRKIAAPAPGDIANAINWLVEKRLIKRPYTYDELVDSRLVR